MQTSPRLAKSRTVLSCANVIITSEAAPPITNFSLFGQIKTSAIIHRQQKTSEAYISRQGIPKCKACALQIMSTKTQSCASFCRWQVNYLLPSVASFKTQSRASFCIWQVNYLQPLTASLKTQGATIAFSIYQDNRLHPSSVCLQDGGHAKQPQA